MTKRICFLLIGSLISSSAAFAYQDSALGVGLGYFSQNVLNKTSQKETGEAGFLGTASYPLTVKYDKAFGGDWFFSPELTYTLIPRSTPGDTAKVTTQHLLFQFGKNGGSSWDWFVGPGLIQYTYKGAGGTAVLNNGTSTATFAVPGKNSTVTQVTANVGGSFSFGNSRIGVELIIENLMSSSKRTQSLLLGYSYIFGDLFR